MNKKSTVKEFLEKLGTVMALLILIVVFCIVMPDKFPRIGNVMNILKQASINCLIASGMLCALITAGIDLSRMQVVVSEDRREVTVSLPASKIVSHEIPQDAIDIVEVKDGLFNKVTLDDYNEFISSQQVVMEQKAINMGLLRQADEAAREAVRALLTAMPGIGDGQDEYKLIIQ